MLMVCEPKSTYAVDKERAIGCQKSADIKCKQIKVASSVHIRQAWGYGKERYYPMRSRISMEGKWLEEIGFHIGNRIWVECMENNIRLYPAA